MARSVRDVWMSERAVVRGVQQSRFHACVVDLHDLYSCDAAPVGWRLVRRVAWPRETGRLAVRSEREGDETFRGHERGGSDRLDRHPLGPRFALAEREHIARAMGEHGSVRSAGGPGAPCAAVAGVGVQAVANCFDLRPAAAIGVGKRSAPAAVDAFRDRIECVVVRFRASAGA